MQELAVPIDDEPAAPRSPVSPTPSTTSTASTTTTNASKTRVIVCRQADEVSSSPSSPTNSYGRLPFSRPIKNPSELDKKVRVVPISCFAQNETSEFQTNIPLFIGFFFHLMCFLSGMSTTSVRARYLLAASLFGDFQLRQTSNSLFLSFSALDRWNNFCWSRRPNAVAPKNTATVWKYTKYRRAYIESETVTSSSAYDIFLQLSACTTCTTIFVAAHLLFVFLYFSIVIQRSPRHGARRRWMVCSSNSFESTVHLLDI